MAILYSRTELVHAIFTLRTGLVLSTSALCTKTTLALVSFSGLIISSNLSNAEDDIGVSFGNNPSTVSNGVNSMTLSTRSIVPPMVEASPPTLRILCITANDPSMTDRIGSRKFVALPVPSGGGGRLPSLPTTPRRTGTLAVAISLQSPISISVDDADADASASAAIATKLSNSSLNFMTSDAHVTNIFPDDDRDDNSSDRSTSRSRAINRSDFSFVDDDDDDIVTCIAREGGGGLRMCHPESRGRDDGPRPWEGWTNARDDDDASCRRADTPTPFTPPTDTTVVIGIRHDAEHSSSGNRTMIIVDN